MTLWIVLTILTAAVAVALAIPVIRRLEAPQTDRDRLLEVSRAQLAEIAADQERGNLSERDATDARGEVERRVLALAKSAPAPLETVTSKGRIWALFAVTGWVVAGATGLYAVLGRPDLPAKPAAVVAVPTNDTVARAAAVAETALSNGSGTNSVEEAITSLLARLQNDPEDAEGWRMLGWSYFNTERYAEAADAYANAVKLDGSLPDVWSAYGETLVRTARGLITDEAVTAFDAALKLNPDDARARFFKGMALEQAGNPIAAIEAWLELAASAPAGADWLSGVVTRIDELAAASSYDIGTRLDGLRPASALAQLPSVARSPDAPADRGPTAADVAAAQSLTADDRQALIQSMVAQLADRLQQSPDDPEGWVKLIRSYMVLLDPAGAATAYQDAKTALGASADKMAIVTEGARAAGLEVN